MERAALVEKAGDALKGSVKLSNEVMGVMELLEKGLAPTPGIIRAMRRYVRDVEAFIDAIDHAPTKIS